MNQCRENKRVFRLLKPVWENKENIKPEKLNFITCPCCNNSFLILRKSYNRKYKYTWCHNCNYKKII